MTNPRTNVLLAVQMRWLDAFTGDVNSPEEFGRKMALELAAVERGFRSALADPLDLVVTLRVPGGSNLNQKTFAIREETE